METLREVGLAVIPWVTLIGLIVHCYLDKKRFVRKDGQ